MGPRDVQEHLRQKPFRPFVIRMNNGDTFEVRHPEMAHVALREVTVATVMTGGFMDEKVFLNIRNISSIDYIDDTQTRRAS